MLEAWIEPGYQPPIPIGDPKLLTPDFAQFGQFTRRQREWLLRRDTDEATGLARCQFQGFTRNRDWVQCPMDEELAGGTRHLHAHHITPQGFWDRWLEPVSGESANQPWNGIILCEEYHHNGPRGIHPDYARAREIYPFNKDSFKEVAQSHHEAIEAQIPYWNTRYDHVLDEIARDRTERYFEEHPDDPWPLKGREYGNRP